MQARNSAVKAILIIIAILFSGVGCSQTKLALKHNPALSKQFEFALIGDVPYGVVEGEQHTEFERLISAINDAPHIKWVLHAGDIKAGHTKCSDALFVDRLRRFNQFKMPVVLTPGDNEWTDCHRKSAGGYQPVERLQTLRKIFYPRPGVTIGGNSMKVQTQAHTPGLEEFPENMRWIEQSVVFATLHIVGSENGLLPFDTQSKAIRSMKDEEEIIRRNHAALTWLSQTFELATEQNAPGVFIMIHANPGLERGTPPSQAYTVFLKAFQTHVTHYSKPVVLAHGDSHYFRVDKPALANNNFLPNFTRVETFGASNVHWIRISVDPLSSNVFSFHQEIINHNPGPAPVN